MAPTTKTTGLLAWLPKLDSGVVFFASGIAAGALNYFFQVIAKRHLADADFSAFTGWFADLSLLFLAGGVLQNFSNFNPASRKHVRLALLAMNVVLVGALITWLLRPGVLTLDRALMIVISTFLFGWLMGQVQIRLAFGVISGVGLLMAASKLAFTFVPFGAANALDRYALALYIALFPALWVMTAYLWNSQTPQIRKIPHSWASIVTLSAAVAIIPMFDLALMHHSLSAEAFVDFANASLFFRAIYVLVSMLAQWLLPRQILDSSARSRFGLMTLLAGSVLLSLALAGASPMISVYVLHMLTPPSQLLVLMTCLHTSLLALILLQIQTCAANGRVKAAALTLTALSLEAAIQLGLHFDAITYLLVASFCQSALLAAHVFSARRSAKRHTPSIIKNARLGRSAS